MSAADPVRWGVMSTAKIGLGKVIPGMQKSDLIEVRAIASRDAGRAREAAERLRIPTAHGSYEALLEDPEVEVVYIPLPNHLHVPWAKRALEAGKHVLVEKPLALSSAEAEELLATAAEHPELKIMEAFMYRHTPQWQRARAIANGAEGGVGEVRTIHSFFSYFNRDPDDVRNQADIGGGGLMDIGCYDISLARFVYGAEPVRVVAWVEFDPDFEVDRLASAILDFGGRTATFTCATQLVPRQRAQIFGTEGRVEIEIPFNAPQDGPMRLHHERGGETRTVTFDRSDQYTLQGEAMSRAVREGAPVPTPLADGMANMRVIEALFESARKGAWVEL